MEAITDGCHKLPSGELGESSPGQPDAGPAVLSVPQFLRRFSAAWVYTSMATAGVSLMEKQRDYRGACDLLRQLLGEPNDRGEYKS